LLCCFQFWKDIPSCLFLLPGWTPCVFECVCIFRCLAVCSCCLDERCVCVPPSLAVSSCTWINACVFPFPWLLVLAGRAPCVCPLALPAPFSNWLDERLCVCVCVCTFLLLSFPLADSSNWLSPFSYLVVGHLCLTSLRLLPLTMNAYVCIWPFLFPWLRPLTGLLLSLTC
jgi:hypothetical protein